MTSPSPFTRAFLRPAADEDYEPPPEFGAGYWVPGCRCTIDVEGTLHLNGCPPHTLAITAAPIRQWAVIEQRTFHTAVFEDESQAMQHALWLAEPEQGTVLRRPDGEEFVIIRRSNRVRVQIVREI